MSMIPCSKLLSELPLVVTVSLGVREIGAAA